MVARWLHELRSEQVGMRPGSDEMQVGAFNLVDQQPVGLDMAVAVVLPLAPKRMILVARQQRIALDQQQDDLPQLRHILAAFLRELYIAAELGAADRGPQRSDPQILEESVGGTISLPLAPIGGAHRLDRGGIGNSHLERQCLFRSHADQQHANRVGHRNTHPSQGLRGPLFGLFVHAHVNHGCRHELHLSEIHCIATGTLAPTCSWESCTAGRDRDLDANTRLAAVVVHAGPPDDCRIDSFRLLPHLFLDMIGILDPLS